MNSSISPTAERIATNVRDIRQRMQVAHAGRSDELPKLIAVTKYAQDDWVEALLQLGECDLGENRPQQLHARAEQFSRDQGAPRWHLIGQLQRNKTRMILETVECIHSVDSVRLLKHIDRIADELVLRPRLLLQVNISGEESKSGFEPAVIREVAGELLEYKHVELSGLMTLAPYSDDERQTRGVFTDLRELRDELESEHTGLNLPELSMGMTNDFEWAIQEGSTMIRIGSGLFAGCEQTAAE